jgi:hypothetical protein
LKSACLLLFFPIFGGFWIKEKKKREEKGISFSSTTNDQQPKAKIYIYIHKIMVFP